jgi:protein O-mannosyl-transferase
MKTEKGTKRFNLTHGTVFLLILLLTLLLYGNTLGHKYCLDDSIVITRNEFTQKGLSGIADIFSTESFTGFFGRQKQLVTGARYRPLSIVSFAIEQEFFHGNPAISHLINILLYALTGFFIYLILKKIIPTKKIVFTRWKISGEFIPLLTALLFVFHPIHTEVVANIKGRDEVMALLFSLVACFAMIRYQERKKVSWLFLGSFIWFAALLSKENAIVFWVILPFVLFLSGKQSLKELILPLVALSLTSVLFLIIRQSVIGGGSSIIGDELMNNSFLHATAGQKYATIFYTLWQYIVLLFFPLQLTYDYYPYHVSLVGWGNFAALAGLFLYSVLIVWLVISVKKDRLVTLALLFYLLPLLPVSNLFFPIGTFMSERFVYFSSIGFCLFVALGFSVIISYSTAWKYFAFSFLGIIFVLFSIKTFHRNKAWYNDYTLFTTDVNTSFQSAKSNCSAGGVLLESTDTIADLQRRQATLSKSIFYLKRAVAIHPRYFDAWLLLGNAYFKKDNATDSVVFCYTNILNYTMHDLAFKNMQALVNREKEVDVKIHLLEKMLLYQPNNYEVNYQLGQLFGKGKNDIEKSILFLEKARLIDPNAKNAYVDLGVAYGIKRDFLKSAEMLLKALEIDPNDANGYVNLGVTYQNLGQQGKASDCFKKAASLKH